MVVCNQRSLRYKVPSICGDEESENEGPEQLQLVFVDSNLGIHEEDE